ncbi:MAG: exodeoxyribonuclease VII small subunit [Actinomycetales bacterium]
MASAKGSTHAESEPTPEPTLPFELARDELAAIVTQLEAGGLGLEDSLRLWQRGEELVGVCQTWLDQAQASIARAIATVEGNPESTD